VHPSNTCPCSVPRVAAKTSPRQANGRQPRYSQIMAAWISLADGSSHEVIHPRRPAHWAAARPARETTEASHLFTWRGNLKNMFERGLRVFSSYEVLGQPGDKFLDEAGH
jgi:hypothetical protein